MGRLPARWPHWLLGLALCAGPAMAQDTDKNKDVVPSGEREGVVHVNAMKDPEMRSYRALVAGLDTFDDHHALAPKVPRLLFQAAPRGKMPSGDKLQARLAADDFSLPLELDALNRFEVPRSRQAWDAKAELLLNRKRHDARIEPWVRTPGLADKQRRLGDIRLECRVKVAIAKEEIPFLAVVTINGLLLTRDWCAWFKGEHDYWGVDAGAALSAATLRQGERSLALKAKGHSFTLPIGDAGWDDDAIVDLEFAPAEAPEELAEQPAVATRTAGETPRTAP